MLSIAAVRPELDLSHLRLDQRGLRARSIKGHQPQQHFRSDRSETINADRAALQRRLTGEFRPIHKGATLQIRLQIAVLRTVLREPWREGELGAALERQLSQHVVNLWRCLRELEVSGQQLVAVGEAWQKQAETKETLAETTDHQFSSGRRTV